MNINHFFSQNKNSLQSLLLAFGEPQSHSRRVSMIIKGNKTLLTTFCNSIEAKGLNTFINECYQTAKFSKVM